jgi:hypothetical protein
MSRRCSQRANPRHGRYTGPKQIVESSSHERGGRRARYVAKLAAGSLLATLGVL